MFSLIITIVAIALVALLVLATMFYGGNALNKGSASAAATTLLNQASQISAARTLAQAEGRALPESIQVVMPADLLKAMPTPPVSAYAEGSPAPEDWQYYNASRAHFGLQTKLNRATCMEVNNKQGFVGIPAAWDAASRVQCFGTESTGYTYLFEPSSITAEQHDEASSQSVADAQVTTPTAVPGYPRYCPDGSTVTTGVCPTATPSNGGGATEPSTPTTPADPGTPKHYNLYAFPGSATTDGSSASFYVSGYQDLCSSNAPFTSLNESTSLQIDGIPVTIDWASGADTPPGQPVCVTINDLPPHAAGVVSLTGTNADGSTLSGTMLYVDAFGAEPEMTSMSPAYGPADKATTTIINGKNFRPGVQLYIMNSGYPVDPATVTVLDGSHVRFTMPPASKVYQPGTKFPQNVQVQAYNTDSRQGSGYTYFMYTEVTNKPNAITLSPNQAYVDGSVSGNGAKATTLVCPSDTASTAFAHGAFVTFGDGAEVVERNAVGNGSGGYCLQTTIPAAKVAGSTAVTVRVTDTVNYTPDTIYTTAFNYLPMTGTKALQISGFMVDGGDMTFTSVENCAAVPKEDICLPAFNTTSTSWTWAFSNVPEQYSEDSTSYVASNGMLAQSETTMYAHGFTITDGVHSYTIEDQITQRMAITGLPFPLSSSAIHGEALTALPDGTLSVDNSALYNTLNAENQNWGMLLYNGAVNKLPDSNIYVFEGYDVFLARNSIIKLNPSYTSGDDCMDWDSLQCTISGPGTAESNPFYISKLTDLVIVGSGAIVRPGVYGGPQGAWPVAPAQ